MNSLRRTLNFIQNEAVDYTPFHPIVMRFAAKHAKVNYRDFCLNYLQKTRAMITCAVDFELDWVTVMSDPYAEAEAFGMQIEYPENNLPFAKQPLIKDLQDAHKVRLPKMEQSLRLLNRIHEIEEFKTQIEDNYFIVGWVEGPMAEYAILRGLSNACLDLFENASMVHDICDIIMENALQFIAAQIKAGAHCIGIGDAACSQIGPELYRKFFWERQKFLVKYIHSKGTLAKIHICGDTTSLLPDIIRTGADIIDVDHLVPAMENYTTCLSKQQVLCGNCDPVNIIQNGDKNSIYKCVFNCYQQTKSRVIVSAGCEITPDTTKKNIRIFKDACMNLGKKENNSPYQSFI